MDTPPGPFPQRTGRGPSKQAAYLAASLQWHTVIEQLGRAVFEVRTLLGWSQQRLADRAVLSQGAISRLEAGHTDEMPFRTVAAALQTLGVAAQLSGLTLSPSLQALLDFLGPALGTILAPEADPSVATLVHAYHRCPDTPQRALVQLAVTLAGPIPEPEPDYDEHLPPPTVGG